MAEVEEHETMKYCWWRSAALFQECATLKLVEIPNMSNMSPKFKLLREMERLALLATDGLDEIRHKIVAYKSGDFWVPYGGIKKQDMSIPPVITILLVGFHNAGKSSLINLMYSVLGRSGLVPFAQTSSGSMSHCTTMFMTEHNVLWSQRTGFCFYDTRGFEYDGVNECAEEVARWIADGVHHNQICPRSGDNMLSENELPMLRSSMKFASRKVNCAMVVANVAEIYKSLKATDKEPLESLRQLFASPSLRKCNENPILILTYGDKLSTEDRIDVRIRICEHLGISEITGAYDIICLTEYGFVAEEADPVTAYALCEAIYRTLLISDRSHLPKTRLRDSILLALSWFNCSIGAFFAFLGHFFTKLGQRRGFKF